MGNVMLASGAQSWCTTEGVFSHSARTVPIITPFIPGIPLKTTHLQKHACSIPKLCN